MLLPLAVAAHDVKLRRSERPVLLWCLPPAAHPYGLGRRAALLLRAARRSNCYNLAQHVAVAHGQRLRSIMTVQIRDDLDWRAARRPGTMTVTTVMLATVSLP